MTAVPPACSGGQPGPAGASPGGSCVSAAASAEITEGLIDRVGEAGHGAERQAVIPLPGGRGSSPPAGAAVTAVDPHRGQPCPPGRNVVVVKALRHVQQPGAADPKAPERFVQGAEVVLGGLVGAGVLGGDDGGEVAVKLPVAGREAGAVHVGQDDQLVVPAQPGQGVSGVG